MLGDLGLGVPAAVLAGVPAGLTSPDGGCESPLAPMENLGVCFGYAGTASSGFSCL